MQILNRHQGLHVHFPNITAVPDAVFIYDTDGRFVEANPLACDILGYSRAALVNMSVADVEPNFNLTQAQQRWEQIEAGKPLTIHREYRHHQGRTLFLDVHVGLLMVMGQRFYIATVRDLSLLQSLQNALRSSEERFQQAARVAQFGTFSDNLLTCRVHWSDEFRAIVGIGKNDPTKVSGGIPDFVHPDDQEFVQMALNHARDRSSNGQLDSIHRIVRRCDGALRWVRVIGNVVFEGAGALRRPQEVQGLLIDITDRMQVKQELLESQQRFELALNASPVALFEQDVALRYTWYCNSNLGFNASDILGRTDMDIMDPQSAQLVTALKLGVVQTGAPVRQEVSVRRVDGSLVHLDVTLRARRNARGEISGLMGTGFDITEARNAKVRLEELNAELKLRSMEVESVNMIRSRFLSTVSHELRTPLHTMLGYLRLAMLDSQGEVRAHLQIVERSGRQLLKQIGDLLSFNRLDKELGTLQPEGVELRSVIEQLERTGLILAQAGTNQFRLDMAADLPAMVSMDEYRLMQVLDNLISNACKFTREGDVTLQIRREAQASEDAQRCHLRFSVTDTGVGIAPRDQGKIFDPFVRLEGNQFSPGLGLGLSIARQWVRAMGSDIQVESSVGQGSCFYFVLELPVLALHVQSPSLECLQHCNTLSRQKRTLLVVDDVAESRQLLRQVCTGWGYCVEEAENITQALECLGNTAMHIDAVLVDQFMPGGSGWELLRHVRSACARASMPVVLVSASDPQRPEGFPTALQFDLVMGKPLVFQDLACFLCRSLQLVTCAAWDDADSSAPSTEPVRVVLPEADLQYFRQSLGLGRVVRIAQWAEALAMRDARYRYFSDQVVGMCKAADLLGLEQLAKQAVSDTRAAAQHRLP